MIAQVFATTGPAGPQTDEFRKFSEEALGQGRKMDGCEGTLSLTDPGTGKGLVINLFRDQAAMDAFQAYSNKKIVEAEKLTGVKVPAPDVYTEVIALL
jgi:quinol monooxygenase YgiN